MLTPMQQFIQDRILLSIYPGCTLEEAREKELQFGCIVLISHKSDKYNYNGGNPDFETINDESEFIYIDDEFCWSNRNGIEDYAARHKNPFCTVCVDGNKCNIKKIIGLPPTLSRVLTALGIEFYFWNGIRHAEKISNNYENRKYICDRKLLNSEGTDATLFDQSEETQKAIALLLGWKDE